MRSCVLSVLALVVFAPYVSAAPSDVPASVLFAGPAHDPWAISWLPVSEETAPALPRYAFLVPTTLLAQGDPQPLHAGAVEHSSAYETRAKIHKYASFATLPLFAAELVLGQSLYNNSANVNTRRTAHGIVGASIMGLFAVNTVTGAWNLFGEGRRDHEGRTLRLVHGLLMMASDVGMLATSRSGPNSQSPRQALTFETNKVTHRNLAIASISVGTVGYLVMLIGNHH